jgi:hypothetical protein
MPRGRKGLDASSIGNVRSATQVNEVSASVDGSACSVGDFGGDDLFLEGVACEHVEGFFFGDYQAFEFLLFFDDFLDFCFDWFVCKFKRRECLLIIMML